MAPSCIFCNLIRVTFESFCTLMHLPCLIQLMHLFKIFNKDAFHLHLFNSLREFITLFEPQIKLLFFDQQKCVIPEKDPQKIFSLNFERTFEVLFVKKKYRFSKLKISWCKMGWTLEFIGSFLRAQHLINTKNPSPPMQLGLKLTYL